MTKYLEWHVFFLKKTLVRPRGVEIRSPLDQISLTPNTKGFQLYFHPRAPPSWSKQAKRLIFDTLNESDEKDDLKVTGHREKFVKLWFKLFFKKSHSNLGSFLSCQQFLAHFHYLGFLKKNCWILKLYFLKKLKNSAVVFHAKFY